MTEHHAHSNSTPRRFVVGLLVFGAAAGCHRPPPPAPSPAPPAAPATPSPQTPPPPAITNGAALVRAMRGKYTNWYRSLTFVQKTTLNTAAGGELAQTWYEAGAIPGRLRIDTDIATKTGTLFARDSIYSFQNGKLIRADTGLNELLVLGFDVYVQAATRTEAQLRGLGFDLTRIHEATWAGQPVYVVGAARGDTVSKQFWIDKEKLLFVRLLENGRQGRVDLRFDKYTRIGGGWVAAEVVQMVNGKRRILEEYTDIRANVAVSDALFDPKQWATAPHWIKSAPGRDY